MWSSNLDNSINSDGGFLNDSRKGGQDDTKVRRVQNVFPVMIRQLLSMSSAQETKLCGIPVHMFTIIGIVRNVEETATKISYDVEDQTGTITVLKWLEAVKKTSDVIMQINTYVRIIGLLREQNEKRHLFILRIYPLQDLNELTNHLLEVTYVSLKGEAFVKKKKETNGNSGALDNTSSEDSPYYGMTADQTLVYKIIHARNDTESGIERSEIISQVPKRVLSNMESILDFLVSEGHIYTTSTDDHFKTT